MTIGERIKQRRNELGLSQSDLARRMGYSGKSVICKVETACDDNFTTSRILKFAEVLECSPSYLMGWDNGKSNETKCLLDKLCKLNESDLKKLDNYIDFLLFKK